MIAKTEAERRVITAVKCQMLRLTHQLDATNKKIEDFLVRLTNIRSAFESSEPEGYAALRQLLEAH